MLSINLISEKLKREIKLKHAYNLLKKINYVLIILTILVSASILTAKIILQNNFNKIVAETTLVTKTSQPFNTRVKAINLKIATIGQIQDEYMPFTYLLGNIASNTPPGITYSQISINKDSQTIKIRGNADSRDTLLAYKTMLENNKILKNIDFPLKNILQKESTDFEIDSNLDITLLKSQF